MDQFNLDETNVAKIPKLKVDFDEKSFGPYFRPTDIILDVVTGVPDLPQKYAHKLDTETQMGNDVQFIFSKELLGNICERRGGTKGVIYCRQVTRNGYIKNYWPPVISVVTLGVANLFGMKFKRQVFEVNIEVDIYDLDDNLVSTYSAVGAGEADVKAYTGYSEKGAQRTAFAFAFTDALQQIKDDMYEDFDFINKSLKK
jgi:hypothetical protein